MGRARESAVETAGGGERVSDTAGTRRVCGARDDGWDGITEREQERQRGGGDGDGGVEAREEKEREWN